MKPTIRTAIASMILCVGFAASWMACVGDDPGATTGGAGEYGGRCLDGERCNEGLVCVQRVTCLKPGETLVDGGIVVPSDGGGDGGTTGTDANGVDGSSEDGGSGDGGSGSCTSLKEVGGTFDCFAANNQIVSCQGGTQKCCPNEGCKQVIGESCTNAPTAFIRCWSNLNCSSTEVCCMGGDLAANSLCGTDMTFGGFTAPPECKAEGSCVGGNNLRLCPIAGQPAGCGDGGGTSGNSCKATAFQFDNNNYVVNVCR